MDFLEVVAEEDLFLGKTLVYASTTGSRERVPMKEIEGYKGFDYFNELRRASGSPYVYPGPHVVDASELKAIRNAIGYWQKLVRARAIQVPEDVLTQV